MQVALVSFCRVHVKVPAAQFRPLSQIVFGFRATRRFCWSNVPMIESVHVNFSVGNSDACDIWPCPDSSKQRRAVRMIPWSVPIHTGTSWPSSQQPLRIERSCASQPCRGRSAFGGGGGGGGGGGNNGGGGYNPNRTYDSSGPEIKIRGSASHVYEKYLQLARDANSGGDRVMAENYLQHAEHYYRIMAAAAAQQAQYAAQQAAQNPRPVGADGQPQPQQQPQQPQNNGPSFSLTEGSGEEENEEADAS